jgi:hypothetical protein
VNVAGGCGGRGLCRPMHVRVADGRKERPKRQAAVLFPRVKRLQAGTGGRAGAAAAGRAPPRSALLAGSCCCETLCKRVTGGVRRSLASAADARGRTSRVAPRAAGRLACLKGCGASRPLWGVGRGWGSREPWCGRGTWRRSLGWSLGVGPGGDWARQRLGGGLFGSGYQGRGAGWETQLAWGARAQGRHNAHTGRGGAGRGGAGRGRAGGAGRGDARGVLAGGTGGVVDKGGQGRRQQRWDDSRGDAFGNAEERVWHACQAGGVALGGHGRLVAGSYGWRAGLRTQHSAPPRGALRATCRRGRLTSARAPHISAGASSHQRVHEGGVGLLDRVAEQPEGMNGRGAAARSSVKGAPGRARLLLGVSCVWRCDRRGCPPPVLPASPSASPPGPPARAHMMSLILPSGPNTSTSTPSMASGGPPAKPLLGTSWGGRRGEHAGRRVEGAGGVGYCWRRLHN